MCVDRLFSRGWRLWIGSNEGSELEKFFVAIFLLVLIVWLSNVMMVWL